MIKITFREQGPTPRGMARHLRRVEKMMWQNLGEFWHKTMRPKHFTHAGAREYGYRPRKGERGNPHPKGFARSYTGRKLKKFGHTLPMVFTGESRSLTGIRDVRATSKGTRVVMRARGLNRRNRHSNINMREEMTRISILEKKQLEARGTVRFEAAMNNIPHRSTRRAARS